MNLKDATQLWGEAELRRGGFAPYAVQQDAPAAPREAPPESIAHDTTAIARRHRELFPKSIV